MWLKPSSIQLLRFPFSFFLMPVYWFALSCVQGIEVTKAILVFFIIHLLVYPASNGYNSYMDRDTESIGGIRHPMAPEKELFYVTLLMDLLAIALSLIISWFFTVLLVCYIVCSRLYSYRGIRLKKYPVIGYLTVILNQGGLMFLLVFHSSARVPLTEIPWVQMLAACLLIGGFYPITQVYQHEADRKDGVKTLSLLLGIKGTFLFCILIYLAAFMVLFYYYLTHDQLSSFFTLQIFFVPVLVYFFIWMNQVWKIKAMADFSHTMKMNWLASACTNLAFITLLILHNIG